MLAARRAPVPSQLGWAAPESPDDAKTVIPRLAACRNNVCVCPSSAGSMPGVDAGGLIHADLHLGNAIFQGGDVKLIDFDDCGTGPRVYELAVALWELRDQPNYPAYRDALLAGYRARREIDVAHLDDFIALRQVAFDLWYTGTAQVNPAFAERLDTVHRWSLAILDLVGEH